MSRRLPVYLLVDTSGSMSGEPIEQVRTGIDALVSGLRQDPQALETAALSIIGYGTTANVLAPMTSLVDFQPVDIQAGGTTAMGAALKLAAENAIKDKRPGDWRPMAWIMTDGMPTDMPDDRFDKILAEFKKAKWSAVVACGVNGADMATLERIAGKERLLQLDTANPAAMQAFFEYFTASVTTASQGIEPPAEGQNGVDVLPDPPSELLPP